MNKQTDDYLYGGMQNGEVACLLSAWNDCYQLLITAFQKCALAHPHSSEHMLILLNAGLGALYESSRTFGACHERCFRDYALARIEVAMLMVVKNSFRGCKVPSPLTLISSIIQVTNSIAGRTALDLDIDIGSQDSLFNSVRSQSLRASVDGILDDALRKKTRKLRISLEGNSTRIFYDVGGNWSEVYSLPTWYFLAIQMHLYIDSAPLLEDLCGRSVWISRQLSIGGCYIEVRCDVCGRTMELNVHGRPCGE